LISIISLTTRITQQYLRRAKSGRNYKYSKKNKKFEDLSHEEKLLIFYPKFSLANLVEIMREDELLKKKLYNVYARSQVKLTYCYIIWIWIFIFISFTTIIFNHGIMTIARTQPNYGFIPKKKIKNLKDNFIFPDNYLAYVFTIATLRIIYITYVTKFYNWKSIYYTKGILNKFVMLLTMLLGAIFDVYMSIRETIPLDFLFDPY
jgi:hypothetical protein